MHEFISELTLFSEEIVEAVNIDEGVDDTLAKLRMIEEKKTSSEGDGVSFKKCVVLVGTPGNFTSLIGEDRFRYKLYSVVLDKMDLL